MSNSTFFSSLKSLGRRTRQSTSRRSGRRRLRVEIMEARRLLAVLTVDNSDLDKANASDTDKLFAEIYEAVEAASPGDQIKVEAGTYKPFVVAVGKDNLTIREANANSNPVIDAEGGFYGVNIEADGVTVRGLEARHATAGFDEGFAFTVSGSNNKLINNVGIDSTHGFDINGILGDGDGNLLIGNTHRFQYRNHAHGEPGQ